MPIQMVNVIGKMMGQTKLSSRSLDTVWTTYFHFRSDSAPRGNVEASADSDSALTLSLPTEIEFAIP